MGIKCEVCGCENIIKKDGTFVCEGCGVKYSIEEMRKLLSEGSHSQQADGSLMQEIQKAYECARDEDSEEAFMKLSAFADQGIAEAQYRVGLCYYSGFGTYKDPQLAAGYYIKAGISQNHSDALTELGILYEEGEGVPFDTDAAIRCYEGAIKQNNPRAMMCLGSLYKRGFGVEQDGQEAHKWFLKSAELGFARGMGCVAEDYMFGIGVQKDMKQAALWNEKAAKAGLDASMYNLGLQYLKGDGIGQDKEQGLYWVIEAARREYPLAISFCLRHGIDPEEY